MEELKKAITEGDPEVAEEQARKVLDSGVDGSQALNEAVIPGILEAGELWKQGLYFVPDVIMSAEAFKAAMAVLEKDQPNISAKTIGKYVICTVAGDIHDLGKDIVCSMLKASGFEVHDLGVDVPISTFIEKVKEVHPDIVGLGAYMSTTAATMKDYIKAIENEGLRSSLKVMIGGVRTSEQYAKELGADAWGRDGVHTAENALKLMGVEK
ncbi:MAG: B12-binding domain-containing protein [Candidatus Thorarchaeota archaeon]